MKKTLSLFASLLFLASLAVPTILAEEMPPTCDATGCHKPGIALVAGLHR